MVTTAARPATWDLFRDSGEPRPPTPWRTDLVTALLGVWFALGMFVDAWAHSNVPGLETFFTPWHAVFYSGFAATAGWILWTVRGHVRDGRRGAAAVPVGYGTAVVALPIFAVSGGADLLWHELLGIETENRLFFSPSHLGLVVSMVLILTTPLRAAWARHPAGSRPTLRALLPALLGLAFAISLVVLFVNYVSPLGFSAERIVAALSIHEGEDTNRLFGGVLVLGALLLGPLLLVARRWPLPPGAVTIVYAATALIAATSAGFERWTVFAALLVAGALVDALAAALRPTGGRRTAYWLFGALAPALTWSSYLVLGSVAAGGPPAIVEFWTGIPVVAGLAGWALAVLMLPTALAHRPTATPGLD